LPTIQVISTLLHIRNYLLDVRLAQKLHN